MKFTTTLIVLLSASATLAAPAEECSGLGGPMDLSELPEGTDPSTVRKCKEHPNYNAINEDTSSLLVKRSCAKRPYGCEKGYCWKKCTGAAEGPWCWLAAQQGKGDWLTCSTDGECSPAQLPGSGCGQGNCKACGCGC